MQASLPSIVRMVRYVIQVLYVYSIEHALITIPTVSTTSVKAASLSAFSESDGYQPVQHRDLLTQMANSALESSLTSPATVRCRIEETWTRTQRKTRTKRITTKVAVPISTSNSKRRSPKEWKPKRAISSISRSLSPTVRDRRQRDSKTEQSTPIST